MNVEPNNKKAKAAKDAPSDMPVGSIYFTSEIIARVATFANAVSADGSPSDVKNICRAVGPMPSRIIKHVYLKKNMRYLEKVIRLFTAAVFNERDGAANWAKECHLAWMSVNTSRKSLVTDELMARYRTGGPLIFTAPPSIHPLLAMINPVVAIEMDLLDALKYLVEVKGIDINATRWTGLSQWLSDEYPHLIATSISVDNYDAFQYLMSQDAIDIYGLRRNFHATSFDKVSFFRCAIDAYIEDENKKRYFDAFVKHAKFRANARFYTGGDLTETCLHFFLKNSLRAHGKEGSKRALEAVQRLLDAGADPNLAFHDLRSPLQVANEDYAAVLALPDDEWYIDALNEMKKIMSEHPSRS